MRPFHLARSNRYGSIYSIRLDLHLQEDVGLRTYHVEHVTRSQPPITRHELEFQLRYDKADRQFLHLGPAEGHRPGIAVAFPLYLHQPHPDQRTFALLAVHPPVNDARKRDNFPTITVHGFAIVEDLGGKDIEEEMLKVPRPSGQNMRAGDVLSIRQVYREVLLLHGM